MGSEGLKISGIPLIPESGGDDETSMFMQIGMLFYLISAMMMSIWGIYQFFKPYHIGSAIVTIIIGILSFAIYLHEYNLFYRLYLEKKMYEVIKRMPINIVLGIIFGLILGGFLFILAYLNMKHATAAPKAQVIEATPICKDCGAEIPKDTFICPRCGTDHKR